MVTALRKLTNQMLKLLVANPDLPMNLKGQAKTKHSHLSIHTTNHTSEKLNIKQVWEELTKPRKIKILQPLICKFCVSENLRLCYRKSEELSGERGRGRIAVGMKAAVVFDWSETENSWMGIKWGRQRKKITFFFWKKKIVINVCSQKVKKTSNVSFVWEGGISNSQRKALRFHASHSTLSTLEELKIKSTTKVANQTHF